MRLLTIIVLSVLVAGSAMADKRWSRSDAENWSKWENSQHNGSGYHDSDSDDDDSDSDDDSSSGEDWDSYRSEIASKTGHGYGYGHGNGYGSGNGNGYGRGKGRGQNLRGIDLSKLNTGVCDELAGATRGLRLLCVAFCELQDCQPDYSLDNPFQNCSKSSEFLLDVYEARRGAGDPDMPCIKQPESTAECPCWARNELADLRYNGNPDETAVCFQNVTSTGITNYDAWQISAAPGVPAFLTALSTIEHSEADGSAVCSLVDTCEDGNCMDASRYMGLTPAQFEACEADIAQSAMNRGLTCMDLGQ